MVSEPKWGLPHLGLDTSKAFHKIWVILNLSKSKWILPLIGSNRWNLCWQQCPTYCCAWLVDTAPRFFVLVFLSNCFFILPSVLLSEPLSQTDPGSRAGWRKSRAESCFSVLTISSCTFAPKYSNFRCRIVDEQCVNNVVHKIIEPWAIQKNCAWCCIVYLSKQIYEVLLVCDHLELLLWRTLGNLIRHSRNHGFSCSTAYFAEMHLC